MAVELARAYVTVLPSSAGLGYSIAKELEGLDVEKPLAKPQAKFQTSWLSATGKTMQGVGKGIEGVGKKLTNSITKPAGIAAGAVAGIALAGGWKRLTSIENAQAGIEGLGFSAKDAARIIQEDVMAAVDGTAFALQDAGQLAAGFLSSGVQPGKELTGILSLVGDAAALSGADFSTMGDIFQKVRGEGKVTGSTLFQMTQNGLYAVPMLAKAFGKSEEEIRKMASAGEISADMFETALRDQIGGTAKTAGQTTQASFANMRTAISNFGAVVLADTLPILRDLFGTIKDLFKSDEMKALAADLGKSLSGIAKVAADAIKGILTWFTQLGPGGQKSILMVVGAAIALGPTLVAVGRAVQLVGGAMSGLSAGAATVAKFGGSFAAIGKAVAKVGPMFGKLGGLFKTLGTVGVAVFKGLGVAVRVAAAGVRVLGAAIMANPIGLIVAGVALAVTALVWFFTQTETGRELWGKFVNWLKQLWAGIVDFAVQVWGALAPYLSGLWEGIKTTATAVWNGIKAAIGFVWQAIVWVFKNLSPVGFIITHWNTIKAVTAAVWNGIKAALSAVWQAIVWVFKNLSPVGLVITHWQKIKQTTTAVWNAIKSFMTGLWNALVSFVGNAAKNIYNRVRAAFDQTRANSVRIWTALRSGVQNIMNGMRAAVVNVANAIKNGIINAWNSARARAVAIFQSMRSGILAPINGALGAVRAMPGRIKGAFSGAGSWLYRSGRSVIDGFVRGIQSAAGKVTSAVKNVVNSARRLFPFSPAKEGPFSGRGWVLYSGISIGEAFADGMERTESEVEKAARLLADAAVIDVPGPHIGAPTVDTWTPAAEGMPMPPRRSMPAPADSLFGGQVRGAQPVELNQTIMTQDPEAAAQRSSRLIMAGLA